MNTNHHSRLSKLIRKNESSQEIEFTKSCIHTLKCLFDWLDIDSNHYLNFVELSRFYACKFLSMTMS